MFHYRLLSFCYGEFHSSSFTGLLITNLKHNLPVFGEVGPHGGDVIGPLNVLIVPLYKVDQHERVEADVEVLLKVRPPEHIRQLSIMGYT